MEWEVEYTDEFGVWWDSLSENEQAELAAKVELLREFGPTALHRFSFEPVRNACAVELWPGYVGPVQESLFETAAQGAGE